MILEMKSASIRVFILLLIFITGPILLSFSKIISAYASTSTSLKYTALGDSITIASPPYSDGTPNYVDRYKNYVTTDLGVPVSTTNLGINGLTSAGLLDKLKNDQNFRASVKNANVITLFIGFNDYQLARFNFYAGTCGGVDNQDCLRNNVANFNSNFTNIVSEIKSINPNPNTVFLASDLYNSWMQSDINAGNQTILIPYFNQFNSYIHSIGASNGLTVTNVYQAFNGASGLEDPIAKGYIYVSNYPNVVHPSGQGHEVIATQFRNLNNVLLAKDTDGDGFSNGAEKYMGTNLLTSCPTSSLQQSWPPDLNNDGYISVADITAVVQKFGTTLPRYDFNQDGKVTVVDILIVRSYYSQHCKP